MERIRAGRPFEGLACHHVRVLADPLTPVAALVHWRNYRGDEVDLVVEHGRRVVALEVKATRRPAAEDVRGLRAFLRGSPEAAGLLVHGGLERRRMDRGIWAVPWTDPARGRRAAGGGAILTGRRSESTDCEPFTSAAARRTAEPRRPVSAEARCGGRCRRRGDSIPLRDCRRFDDANMSVAHTVSRPCSAGECGGSREPAVPSLST